MNKPHMVYFEKEDILHLTISEGPEARSAEVSPNITIELNDEHVPVSVEGLMATPD